MRMRFITHTELLPSRQLIYLVAVSKAFKNAKLSMYACSIDFLYNMHAKSVY